MTASNVEAKNKPKKMYDLVKMIAILQAKTTTKKRKKKKQAAHGPHRLPEKQFLFNKQS